MTTAFRSTQDIIIRTDAFAKAIEFYSAVLGFRVTMKEDNLVGFDTGSFRLYVEGGAAHGPVFEFLVADVPAAHLLAAGCSLIEEDPTVPRCYLRDPFGLTFNVGKAKSV